jgi:hypothetical protein
VVWYGMVIEGQGGRGDKGEVEGRGLLEVADAELSPAEGGRTRRCLDPLRLHQEPCQAGERG